MPVRLWLWTPALLLEYAAAWLGYWTPGLGRSTTADWRVSGAHMAERCGLFVIIALGESILVTGATFSKAPWTTEIVTAFAAAFLGSVAMWWIYFNAVASRSSQAIAASSDPGRLARSAYTFLHIPIVAGIVVAAVGDELLLAQPNGRPELRMLLTMVGGPAIYLLGVLLFEWSVSRNISMSKALGLAALGLLAPSVGGLTSLGLGCIVMLILAIVSGCEAVQLSRPAPNK